MDLLADFPHLIPQDRESRHYDGYLCIAKRLYRLEVKLGPAGLDGASVGPAGLDGASVSCDWNLQQILGSFTHILQQRLKQCDSLHAFLKELQSIVERQLESEEDPSTRSSQFCGHLISHIEALGWDKLVYIDPSFTQLHLQYKDAGNRTHLLKLTIGNQYPEECPRCSVELPRKFDVHWNAQSELCHIYTQFVQAVQTYQDFWAQLATLDQNTWVLEPDRPTYSARHRRIAISASASIQVMVDPGHPKQLPECRFLGADQAVAPIRHSMNINLHLWDDSKTLLDNLQTLLAVSFPSPTNSTKEEFSVECGICYSYRLDTEIPDEVCNDRRCGQAFHKSCLVEWLRALPSTRQSFNTIFGECPFCEKALTVKMVVK